MDKDLKHLSPQIYRTRGGRERKKFRQGSHVRGSWPCAGSFTQHVLFSPWPDLAPSTSPVCGYRGDRSIHQVGVPEPGLEQKKNVEE